MLELIRPSRYQTHWEINGLRAPPQGTAPFVQLWYASGTLAGSNTVTVTQESTLYASGSNFWLLEYSGAATANPGDVTAGQLAPGNTATMTTGSMTPSSNCNELVVGAFVDLAQTITTASPWTARATDGSYYVLVEDNTANLILPNTPINPSATLAAADNAWLATAVAFRAQGSATPPGPTQLAFTSVSGTINTWVCSGLLNVQSQNGGGSPMNTPSGIQVNLSGGPNLIFYQDSGCTQPITTANIWAGTNSTSFYYMSSNPASNVITASATGLTSGTFTETVNWNPQTWKGGAGCTNWNTAVGCWYGGAFPTVGQIAHFDAYCTVSCSPAQSLPSTWEDLPFTPITPAFLRKGHSHSRWAHRA